MVSSRHRSSTASSKEAPVQEKEPSGPSKVPKDLPREWTIKEKLYLASLALKYNNSWNTVARQMQSFIERDKPDDEERTHRVDQKICAAQFDKLMNELGVDKRPKRNETTDATGFVIYKKMAEKRMKELEENIIEYRKSWLQACENIENPEDTQQVAREIKLESTGKPRGRQPAATSTPKSSIANARANTSTSSRANTSISNDSEKPTPRARTRGESSRQNLEKTFSSLYEDASKHEGLTKLGKPPSDVEKTLGSYDKVILQHVDMNTIKKKFSGDIQDPFALMNEFLLMFQNATMYYPLDHPNYSLAVDLRDKLIPEWEKLIFERNRGKH